MTTHDTSSRRAAASGKERGGKTADEDCVAVAGAPDGKTPDDTHGQETPLPPKLMLAIALVLLSEAVGSAMLLPFVATFVTYLQHYENTKEAGRTTGILIGLFMLGQVVSGKLWGYVSDVYGRRFPILFGIFASGVTIFFFGMSPNFTVCCVLRFIHGIFNGVTLVAKTVIADITDKTNEAKGFAMVSITWGVGSLIGPAIGGFLYGPATNTKLSWLHVTETDFLGRNPAFLPCAVVFVYSMVTFVAVLLYLDETNPYCKSLYDAKIVRFLAPYIPGLSRQKKATGVVIEAGPLDANESGDAAQDATDGSTEPTPGHDPAAAMRSTFAAAQGEANPEHRFKDGAIQSSPTASGPTSGKRSTGQRRNLSYSQAMRIVPVRNITIFYVLLSAADMTFSQILPLWGVAEKDVGGLLFNPDTIGVILLICSVPSVAANLGFHKVCEFMNNDYKKFWVISMGVYSLSTALTPEATMLSGDTARLVYISAFGVVRQIGQSWGYSLVHMLTAKAAPLGCVGAVYGISQSCASLIRSIVPFIVSPAFAWTIDRVRPFPFNHYCLFLCAALCSAVAMVLSYFLRITRNEEDDAQEETLFAVAHSKTGSAPAGPQNFGELCVVVEDGRSNASLHDDASDEDVDEDGLHGAYLALVASFCTNPVSDNAVPMSELRRVNREAHEERMARQEGKNLRVADGSTDDGTSAPRDVANLQDGGARSAIVSSPVSAGESSGHQHVVRASTAALLASLRVQHVESRRQEDEDEGADLTAK